MKLLKQASMWSLSAAVTLLAACGGSSNGSSTPDNLNLPSATLELGQADFTGGQPNRGAGAADNTLNSPFGGVATGGTGSTLYYVVDTNNSRILGYNTVPAASNASANFVLGHPDVPPALTSTAANNNATIGALTLAFPSSATISGSKLVVTDTDNNRVLIWTSLPANNSTPPNVVVGQTDFVSGTAATTQTGLSSPQSAMIANGKLIVADTGNNRVLIWNTVPTTNGAPADVVLGQGVDTSSGSPVNVATTFTNTSNQGSTPTQASLRQPQGLWTDGFNLLVSDTGTNRVLYWKQIPTASGANALYVLGRGINGSFISSTASSSSSLMNSPTGVYYDGTRIFVADTGNNRVLVFVGFPLGNSSIASAVLGQEDFSHNVANDDSGASLDPQDGISDAAPTQRTLSRPTGVFFAGGNLYVTDTGNSRVMVYAPPFKAPGT